MSSPTRPIPSSQSRAFNLAMCERLGLDAGEVCDDFRADWVVIGGDEYARVSVSFTIHLPAAELIAMFNSAGAEARHCHADGAGPCLADDCPIAGQGPVVAGRGRWLRPCPGAPGPQHPADAPPSGVTHCANCGAQVPVDQPHQDSREEWRP